MEPVDAALLGDLTITQIFHAHNMHLKVKSAYWRYHFYVRQLYDFLNLNFYISVAYDN